eukprot:g2853.t1
MQRNPHVSPRRRLPDPTPSLCHKEFAKETPSLLSCSLSSDALAEMLADSPKGPATGRQLRSLLYADDVVMLAESPEELNAMIEVVRSFYDTRRIEINLAQSQVMEVHPRGVCRKAGSFYYGSKSVEVVHQYKYLGLMLTDTLSWARGKGSQRARGACPFVREERNPLRG